MLKSPGERIVRLAFRVEDELDAIHFRRLAAQLTGRAAVSCSGRTQSSDGCLRSPKGIGQNPGEYFLPPPKHESTVRADLIDFENSPSDAADEQFSKTDSLKQFESTLSRVRGRLKQAKNQKTKLRDNLKKDLQTHGEPETHKRLGDLLLANISTAVREGNEVKITDFYSEDAPIVKVAIDEDTSLQEAAASSFRQYTKAKRAHEEIGERLRRLGDEIAALEQQELQLDRIAREHDESALAELDRPSQAQPKERIKGKGEQQIPECGVIYRLMAMKSWLAALHATTIT